MFSGEGYSFTDIKLINIIKYECVNAEINYPYSYSDEIWIEQIDRSKRGYCVLIYEREVTKFRFKW